MRTRFAAILLLATAVSAPAAEPPILDAHLHYSRDAWDSVPSPQAIALLRKAGVKRALVWSSNDDGNQKLYAEVPDIIVPSLRPHPLARRYRHLGARRRDHRLSRAAAQKIPLRGDHFALHATYSL